MDAIIAIILLIVFVSISGSIKKKNPPKQGNKRPQNVPHMTVSAPEQVKPVTVHKTLHAKGSAPILSTEAYPAEGESFIDDHGCIGGSLGFHSEEGESLQEHAAHMASALPLTDKRTTQTTGRFSAADIRKAVIMREILDRPKSLRRYR